MNDEREREFARLSAMLPRSNAGDYWAGYRQGLRRWYHGESWGDPSTLAILAADEGERGRGYADGLAGRDPSPPAPRIGRPPLPDSEVARVRSIRLNDARWAKLQALREAEPGWLERVIDEAAQDLENGGAG